MGISPIQAINLFRTQPVNFREAQTAQQHSSNPFMGQAFSAANSGYHLEHPKVAGSEILAKKIDLMA